jgi:hypothetical protein
MSTLEHTERYRNQTIRIYRHNSFPQKSIYNHDCSFEIKGKLVCSAGGDYDIVGAIGFAREIIDDRIQEAKELSKK